MQDLPKKPSCQKKSSNAQEMPANSFIFEALSVYILENLLFHEREKPLDYRM